MSFIFEYFFSKCHVTKLNGSSILECCLGIELIRPTKIFQQQHSPQNSAADRPWGKNSPVIVISFHHRGWGTALLFDCSLNGLWLGRFNECLANRNKTFYLNDSISTMTRLTVQLERRLLIHCPDSNVYVKLKDRKRSLSRKNDHNALRH